MPTTNDVTADALGPAGRARCVEHVGAAGLICPAPRGRRRRARRRTTRTHRGRRPPKARRTATPGASFTAPAAAGGELRVGQERLGAGVVEDVGELLGRQVPVERNEDPGRHAAGHDGLDVLAAVAAEHGDGVAVGKARRPEAVDETVDPLVRARSRLIVPNSSMIAGPSGSAAASVPEMLGHARPFRCSRSVRPAEATARIVRAKLRSVADDTWPPLVRRRRRPPRQRLPALLLHQGDRPGGRLPGRRPRPGPRCPGPRRRLRPRPPRPRPRRPGLRGRRRRHLGAVHLPGPGRHAARRCRSPSNAPTPGRCASTRSSTP